jgi:hypothetical protein
LSIKQKFVHYYENHTTCFTLLLSSFYHTKNVWIFFYLIITCLDALSDFGCDTNDHFSLRLLKNTCVKFSDKYMKLKKLCQIFVEIVSSDPNS